MAVLKKTYNIMKEVPFVDKSHPFIRTLINRRLKSGG